MNSGAESDEAEFSDSEDSDASSWCSDEAEVLIHKCWRRDAQTKSSGTSTRDWVMNMDGKYDTESPHANAGNSGLPATFNVLTTIEANPKSTRPFHKRNQKRVRAAIRNLSLTSAQIALELGEVLWSKATVPFESPKCFLAFARDRPAALPLIHGIVVDLNIHAGDWLIEDTAPSMAKMVRVASEQCGNLRSWKAQLQPQTRHHYYTRHDLSQEGRRLNIRARIQGIFRWSIVFAELRPFGRIKKIHPF